MVGCPPSAPVVLCNQTWAMSAAQRRIKIGKIEFPADFSNQCPSQVINAALDSDGKRLLDIGADQKGHVIHRLLAKRIDLLRAAATDFRATSCKSPA